MIWLHIKPMGKLVSLISKFAVIGLIVAIVASLQAINQNSISKLVSSTSVSHSQDTDDDDSGRRLQMIDEDIHTVFILPNRLGSTCGVSYEFPMHLNMSADNFKLKFHKPPSAV